MSWDDTTIRPIEYGMARKVKGKPLYRVSYVGHQVPAAYHRLVAQLVAEELHGLSNSSHEARRRHMYARQVLNRFAEEYIDFSTSPWGERIPRPSFRSHILTPILQRQLRAVHDAYMPSVRAAMIRKGEASLTIARATEIYLHEDPTRAYLIPRYRRHLLYVPEPRWHLGVVVNPGRLLDPDFYNMVREHHEEILLAIRKEAEEWKGKRKERDLEHIVLDSHGMPVLRRAEVRAIVREGLEGFFAQELSAVVCHPTHSASSLVPTTVHIESATG
jgi:hypothetical protein